MIGLVAGAAGGWMIGAAADSQRHTHGFLGCIAPRGKEAFTPPIAAVVGLSLGALLLPGSGREIYRSRQPPPTGACDAPRP